MKLLSKLLSYSSLGIFLTFSSFVYAAETGPCQMAVPSIQTSGSNIFNDRQEQDLGDALAEYVEANLRVAPIDPNDELNRIGTKLLQHMPSTDIHYSFRVYDSGQVNAFSIAGGRVYVSRKLIAAVKNEDELAGVLAHELGHLVTHQSAIQLTQLLRVRLGVTHVGDRADIFAKIHQMLSTEAKDNEPEISEEKDQMVADRISFYALVQAGYAPESLVSFLDQSLANKGKTGNWLTDVFGITSETSQRYRTARKLISTMPESCRNHQTTASNGFLAWQRKLASENITLAATGTEGDQPLRLNPPLRSSLWNIRFSPNGKFVIAQDESSVSVVDVDQGKVLFQVAAPHSNPAVFTPDSSNVVFLNHALRAESWKVSSGARNWTRELVVYDACKETQLLPDGKTVLCIGLKGVDYSFRLSLRLLDVESGQTIYEKQNFYEPGTLNLGPILEYLANLHTVKSLVSAAASQDAHYLLVLAGNAHLAFDLETRKPVVVEGKLKNLRQTQIAFMGADRIYVVGDAKSDTIHTAHIFSFPQGEQLSEHQMGNMKIQGTSNPNYLRISPMKDYNVGILDVGAAKVISYSKLLDLDAYNALTASEDAMGNLLIEKAGDASQRKVIQLPQGPLPELAAETVSQDGHYLSVSLRYRAAVWDLTDGHRRQVTRPYTSAWIDASNHLLAQFPRFLAWDPVELNIDLGSNTAQKLAALDKQAWQYHGLELRLNSNKKKPGQSEEDQLDLDLDHNVTFEAKQMVTQTVAWSRNCPYERPAIWAAEDERIVLGWDISSKEAHSQLKVSPALRTQGGGAEEHNKGILINVLSASTGNVEARTVLPEADLSHGWDDARRTRVSGNYALVTGEHSNVSIYRLDTGAKVGEFFGSFLASSSSLGLVVATNREDEILIVDEQSGKELKRITLGSPVRLARILAASQAAEHPTLLVLTADQTLHRLPLEARH